MFSVHDLTDSLRQGAAFLVTLLLIGIPAPAFAQSGATLKLDDLLLEALSRHPEIAAAAQAVESARSRIPQAGALPDPMLSFQVQNIGESWTVGDEEMSMAGLSISQALPFPGKRALTRSIVNQETARAEAMLEEIKRRVVGELKQHYFDLARIRQSRAILHEIRRLLQTLIETAQARYSVGEGMQQDALQARAEWIRLTDRQFRLDQQEADVKAAVNTTLLRPPDAPLGDPQPLRSPLPPQSASEFETVALARSPRVIASDTAIRMKEQMLKRTLRDRYPDMEIRLGYFDRGGFENLYEAMVSFNLPLYYRSKQSAAIREAQADLTGARHGFAQTEQDVKRKVSQLHREMTTAHRWLELAEQGLLPQDRMAFESARAGYEVGKTDLQRLLNNLMTLLEDEIGLQETLFRYQKALAEMEVLTGLDLISQGGPS